MSLSKEDYYNEPYYDEKTEKLYDSKFLYNQGRKGVNHPKNKVWRSKRDSEILDLYAKGMKVVEIAEVGKEKDWKVGERRINQIISDAIKRVNVDEKAKEVLPIELAKLDRMEIDLNNNPKMVKGSKEYADVQIKIMRLRQEYLGIKANEKKMADNAELNAIANANIAKELVGILDEVLKEIGIALVDRQRVPSIISVKLKEKGLVKEIE